MRTSRGVQLTEAGAILLRRADAIAIELHMAGEELASLSDLHSGTVRLVAFPSAASTIVPMAIQRLKSTAPNIEVRLVEAEPPIALASLQDGTADLAVVFDYTDADATGDPGITRRPVGSEAMHLLRPTAWATPETGDDGRAWMARQDWIVGCPDCRGHLVTTCNSLGFTPNVMHESDDYVVLQSLVAHQLGIAVLPELALSTFRHPGVETRALPEFGRRTVSLAFRSGADDVPATGALISMLAEASRDRLGRPPSAHPVMRSPTVRRP